jgi:futalosine hydrolase
VTLLVVTAVAAERDAVVAGLGAAGGVVAVEVVGVGSAAAAAGTARLLGRGDYRAVVCAGIAGGLGVEPGETVLGTRSIAADLGAQSPDGFIALSELGFGRDAYDADAGLLDALPFAVRGPVVTVNTVTGTAAGLVALRTRHPDAVAEGMEGFGVATAAAGAGIPFVELRTISNPVGPRDRGAWRIGDALAALTTAARALGTLAE